MKALPKILTLILFCCVTELRSTPYFHHLGVPEGLAHPSVMSICQDSLGRMWFGTENGLSIYDGSRLQSYKPYELRDGKLTFRGSVVRGLVCDRYGDVHFLADGEWVHYDVRTEQMSIVDGGPFGALFILDGRVSGVVGRSCMNWDSGSNSLSELERMPFEGVRDYHIDVRGRHWLICPEGLFCREPGAAFNRVSAIGDLQKIFESSEGEIWTGSNTQGLLRIAADGSLTHYRSSSARDKGFDCDNVRAVCESPDGMIWFGTFQGLYSYDRQQDIFRHFVADGAEGSITQSSVHSVFVDYDGMLWAGTYYGGVNYTDTRASAYVFYPSGDAPGGLSSPVVGHLSSSRSGDILICTEGGGINSLDQETGRIRHYRNLPATHAKWVCESDDGSVFYVGTNRRGLYRVDIASGEAVQELRDDGDGCSPRSVVNVVLRYGRDLILSTDDGVFLHSISTGRDELLFPTEGGIRYMHAVVSEDDLWLASGEVVVYSLADMSVKSRYPVVSSGEHVRPMRIFISPEGAVFVTTFGQGLFRLEGNNFVKVPYADFNIFGYQIVSAEEDRIVISGEKGIQIVNVREEKSDHTFQTGSGLPLDALVMDSGLLVTGDGTIFCGGTNGLVSFRPEEVLQQTAGGLYFTELHVDGNPVAPGLAFLQSVKIKAPQSRLDVRMAPRHDITAVSWTDYEYKLVGRDSRWYPVNGPAISMVNLSPGRYSLKLREASRGETEGMTSLDIRILPPAYASWWAKLLYALAVAVLIWALGHAVRVRREASRIVAEERAEKLRLQEINEEKLRFFTSVSHELRTPLTLIIAQLESIFRSFRMPPQLSNKVSKVMDQAGQMNDLVTEIIDFRKYEQDMMKLRVSPVDVNIFVEDVARKFTEMAADKAVDLSFNADPSRPKVYIDVHQMQKVMRNLIFNAVKYTRSGGSITLSVKHDEDDRVEIHVKDTGIGISEEDKEHIFERFYQAGSGQESGIESSGIGLALVRDIVLKHGGSVSVTSKLGLGSDFVVSLRRGSGHFAGDDMIQVEETPAPVPPVERVSGRPTVIIAEDNREMGEILQDIFSVNYNVYLASDGREAWDLVKIITPDLVVSDVMMPRMSGTDLCSAIRNAPATAGIPIVLLTAISDVESQLSGLRKGADDYIPKPFESRVLLARCNNLVNARRRAVSGGADDPGRRVTGAGEKRFIDKVSAVLEENIANPDFNVDTMADRFHMSRSAFYSRFKSVMGETPNDYVSSYRLRKACEMLSADRYATIAEISGRLGFSSQQYFCRRFKAVYGLTPMAYRRASK